MHQQPRSVAPRSPSSSTPQSASQRINSTREAKDNTPTSRPRAASNLSNHEALSAAGPEAAPSLSHLSAESIKKLDQIVQNFFSKIAVLVLDSRIPVKATRGSNGVKKASNKWFQLETDEIDDFREELRTWKTAGSISNRPPPLIIEVFLDASSLKENQSLVVTDDDGKRWDVLEQLNSSRSSDDDNVAGIPSKNAEVILERWRVDLNPSSDLPSSDFGPILPTVYKKAIVFFRSMFTTTRLLPAWKFASQAPARNRHAALRPKCRIRTSRTSSRLDTLRHPIDDRPDPVTDYMFGDLDLPVGRLSTSVTYRNDCSFRIDDSESLLSSRFMGVDDNFFKPSLNQRGEGAQAAEVGSLRDRRRSATLNDVQQAYGSLSTFHGQVPTGTSPISALRSIKPVGSDTESPPPSLPTHAHPDPPNSLPVNRVAMAARVSSRPVDGHGRRPSVSFQPFKTGSLTGSPRLPQHGDEPPSSPQSLTRPSLNALQQPRNRSSLTAGMPASLRGGPQPSTSVGDNVMSSSPRPASVSSRYSSSFTHRRGRLSIGSVSKTGDDEQGSSGRQSLASSVAQPGSGLLAEQGGTSSGSLQNDDDNISEFLKALDSKKTLKRFEGGEAATNRTVAQLSRFQGMRDSNNALTDSMTSSIQLNKSSSSSSRQLPTASAMVAPTTGSASTSPGKPLSPHTPHTPAVPSRLSENSVARYGSERLLRTSSQDHNAESLPSTSRQSTLRQDGVAGAIDIPLSPRFASYQQRRSSSVAQESRHLPDEYDGDLPFARQSTSLGADDREAPTVSGLLGRQMQFAKEATVREDAASSLQPAAEIQESQTTDSSSLRHGSVEGQPPEGFMPSSVSSSPFGRRRYTGLAGRQSRPAPQSHSSRGSFTGSGGRTARDEDSTSINEEPLVFDFSNEGDAQGRRSLEESQRGVSSSSKGLYDQRGTTHRGW